MKLSYQVTAGRGGKNVTAEEVVRATEDFIAFQKELLLRLLLCNIVFHLEPSDVNQMIDEEKEFLRLLDRLLAPPTNPAALHLARLWVPDAAGHSFMLYRVLDPLDKSLKPLMPNHMIREETYFLNRLAQIIGVTV